MSPETRPDPLNQNVARMLIEPERETVPLGVDDAVSSRVYEPMMEAEYTEPMIDLIRYTESRMVEPQLDNVDSEFNQLKIDRLIALVRDMPDELPLEEKTRVWHKLLASDWLHAAGESSHSLEQAIHAVSNKDAELGEELKKVKKNVMLKKLEIVEKTVAGDSRLPSLRDRTISFNESMDIYNVIRQDYPGVLPAYHTLVILSINDRDVEEMMPITADR